MFPNMLDQYQIQLTRLLESEQYGRAKELLRFLLQCQGEDERHYEEWTSLLNWLEMAFPEAGDGDGLVAAPEQEDPDEEALIREQYLNPREQDEAYVQQVLYIMKNHPMPDQQLLALERCVYIQAPAIDEEIVEWLTGDPAIHPVVQFHALQCLRKRGASGKIELERMGETAELEIEKTPLSMDDFPAAVSQIIERVESVTESDDPTLPHFARELWKQSIQFLYGTTSFEWMIGGDEEWVDCYAAALHHVLLLTVYGKADDDFIRETYSITEPLRFRYEQACRTLRQVAALQPPGGNDSQP